MFKFFHRRRKQQKLIADFVRTLRDGVQQRAELTQKYSAAIQKNIELLEQNTALVMESTRLKQIMSAAPVLTAAAEAGIAKVEQVENCWTHPATGRVQ